MKAPGEAAPVRAGRLPGGPHRGCTVPPGGPPSPRLPRSPSVCGQQLWSRPRGSRRARPGCRSSVVHVQLQTWQNCAHVCAHACVVCTRLCRLVFMCACMHTYACVWVCVVLCECVCLHARVHMCTCACVCVYTTELGPQCLSGPLGVLCVCSVRSTLMGSFRSPKTTPRGLFGPGVRGPQPTPEGLGSSPSSTPSSSLLLTATWGGGSRTWLPRALVGDPARGLVFRE